MSVISSAYPTTSPLIYKEAFDSATSLQDKIMTGRSNASRADHGIKPNPQMNAISTLNIPQVSLDVEFITDEIAAKLASCLLGHVLFLKNQVPFPIAQLSRILGGKSNARALKQRSELLASFDTLSSHLDTTYTALSTAFARCNSQHEGSTDSVRYMPKVARAYLAILVGPSLSSAKSKVIFAVEGLKEEVWGQRHTTRPVAENGVSNEEDEVNEEEEQDEDEEDKDGDNPQEEANGDVSEEEPETSDEDSSEDGNDNELDEEEANEAGPSSSPHSSLPSPMPSHVSHAERQRFLHNAERLLSHTLAAADADGHGVTSELSPTQTHILLRAPRRFNHPAWIPRQNMTSAMEGTLVEFLEVSGLPPGLEGSTQPRPKRSKRSTIEGVWITCHAGLASRSCELGKENQVRKDLVHDEDEMIWWSWDGKIVGFSDW